MSASASGADPNGTAKLRHRWTAEEDAILLEFIEEHGARRWKAVAERLPGRNQHHARLRYFNYLQFADAGSRPFTPDEDVAILRCGDCRNSRWNALAKCLRRGDTAVKNRYSLLCRRKSNDPASPTVGTVSNSSSISISSRDRISIQALTS
mmetsp:Transcript_11642/g.31363  ORF Transcript_11642/g.31363 Transcript_11642/m.31363 type:complete len:151 (-) Transcript_11642:61-513(-)